VCGSLGQTPLGELLVQALDRRWTGALEFGGPWAGNVVEFVSGQPARVLVPDDLSRLGEILVERGLVRSEDVTEALARPDFLLGEALIEAEKIEPDTLDRALMLQVLMRMVRLFGKPDEGGEGEASWRFIPDDDRFATLAPPSRVDPLRVLSGAVTVHGVDEGRAALVLALLDDAPLALREGVRIERFAFKGEAQAVAAHITAHRPTFDALVASGVAPEAFCRAVVYLLATTRFLRQGADAHATARPAASSARDTVREEGSTTAKFLSKVTLRRVAVARSQVAGSVASESDGAGAAAARATVTDVPSEAEPSSEPAPISAQEREPLSFRTEAVDAAQGESETAPVTLEERVAQAASGLVVEEDPPEVVDALDVADVPEDVPDEDEAAPSCGPSPSSS